MGAEMSMTIEERIAVWRPEISSEKQKNGERLVTFRDLDGQNHRFVTRDSEEAHGKFLEWIAELREQLRQMAR